MTPRQLAAVFRDRDFSPDHLASRTLHLAYDRWLDGVDTESPGAAEQVLHNVAGSATIGP